MHQLVARFEPERKEHEWHVVTRRDMAVMQSWLTVKQPAEGIKWRE